MPRHEEQKTLAYTADELFAVVADVKDYPSFVPWCSGARIHREDQREIIADLEIGFGPFRESFTSQVTLDRPRQVLVRATEGGPLEHLTNTWTFTPACVMRTARYSRTAGRAAEQFRTRHRRGGRGRPAGLEERCIYRRAG